MEIKSEVDVRLIDSLEGLRGSFGIEVKTILGFLHEGNDFDRIDGADIRDKLPQLKDLFEEKLDLSDE